MFVCIFYHIYRKHTIEQQEKSLAFFVHRQLLTQIMWTRLISPCLKPGVLRRFLINILTLAARFSAAELTFSLILLTPLKNTLLLRLTAEPTPHSNP